MQNPCCIAIEARNLRKNVKDCFFQVIWLFQDSIDTRIFALLVEYALDIWLKGKE